MNLELEQRRTDYDKRTRQLEDQSRYRTSPNTAGPKNWHDSQGNLPFCREIAELRGLLETQTNMSVSLQQELHQRQALISQVGVHHTSEFGLLSHQLQRILS